MKKTKADTLIERAESLARIHLKRAKGDIDRAATTMAAALVREKAFETVCAIVGDTAILNAITEFVKRPSLEVHVTEHVRSFPWGADGKVRTTTAKGPEISRSEAPKVFNAPRSAVRSAAVSAAIQKGLLDTVKLRDGRIVGDLDWIGVTNARREASFDSRILDQIVRYCEGRYANVLNDQKVRDLITEADFGQMVDKAKLAPAA